MKGRLNRESNPVPGEKPGFLPQHESTVSGEFVVTGERNPYPVKVKNTDEQAIPVKLTGSYVGYSNDTKPTGKKGETFLELDTLDVYVNDGTKWVKIE